MRNAVKHRSIEQHVENIHHVLEPLKSVMLPHHYSRVVDSTIMTNGVVFFNHEFGPKRLKWFYSHYTYLFLNAVEKFGELYRLYRNYDESGSHIKISPVGSMICTMVLLEYKDIVDSEELGKNLAMRTMNKMVDEFLPHQELSRSIKQGVREHYDKFIVDGQYRPLVNRLTLRVIEQDREKLYLVR